MPSLLASPRVGRRTTTVPARTLASLVAASFLAHPGFAATEQWQSIPLSINGGEGCQVIQAITVAPSDPNVLFMGTDVAGLYRSTDGAASWQPINNNISPKGATDFAIDPRNPQRVLVAGANAVSDTWNGLWLSTNQGAVWQEVQPFNRVGYRDFRTQIAYDPASYSSALGYTQTVYWSSETRPATVGNTGFESPSLSADTDKLVASPTNATWTFSAAAGIQRNGAALGAPTAPEGSQTAYLQTVSATLGSITRTVTFPLRGDYVIKLSVARPTTVGAAVQPVKVSIDGVQLGTLCSPGATGYTSFTLPPVSIPTDGATRSLRIEATSTTDGAIAFVDNISVTNIGVLYKSTDGGSSWNIVNTTLGKSHLRMHPGGAWLYAANSTGFYRSADGVAFSLLQAGDFRSVAVIEGATVAADQAKVWAGSTARTLYYSANSGASPVAQVLTSPVPSSAAISSIAVNPANSQQIVINGRVTDSDNDFYRTLDGGASWLKSTHSTPNLFVSDTRREGRVVWSGGGALHGIWGSHFLVKSTTSGTSFVTTNNGYAGIAIESGFQFNVQNPDILMLPAVDFNGAQTIDGGATWVRMADMDRQNTSTSNWGWVRAGYAVTENIIYGAASQAWTPYRQDFRRTTTRAQLNGGAAGSQWSTIDYTLINTDSNNIHSAIGDPVFAAACTYYNYLSLDQGQTWAPMTNVRGVLTYDRTVVMNGGVEDRAVSRQWIGTRSYSVGGQGRACIVRATRTLDANGNLTGVVWNDVPGSEYAVSWFTDIAYDHVNQLYYATDSTRVRLLKFNPATQTWTNLASLAPADQYAARIFWSVAVDPVDPRIVYAAGGQNDYCNNNAVVRSTDSGASWTRLTANVAEFGRDGARNAVWVRVHPGTREAWVGTSCYGLWKIARPGGTTGVSVVYNENFNTQATGVAPSGFTVTSTTLLTTADVPSATNKSLRIDDPNAYTAPSATRDLGADLSGIVNIKLRFRLDSVLTWQRPLNVIDSAGNTALSLLVTGGALKTEDASSVYTNVKSSLVAGTWYEVTVVADTVTDECDIYIDGVPVLTSHPLRLPIANVRKISFLSGTSTILTNPNYMFIDDILVSQ
ncbi:MAG: hypothetical protein H7067_07805 [Burkholderiales bacterium]|nr:hypothetical protein [Opitutaceae bacterium]